MSMTMVYLKGGITVEVPLEELEDYFYNNANKIETRHREVRRKILTDSATEIKAHQ